MKILVLGGSGMVGHKMWQHLRETFPETYASVRKDAAFYRKYDFFDESKLVDHLDVQDINKLMRTLDELKPRYVINCIAVTLRRDALNRYSETIYLNSMLPHLLKEWANRNNARVIHFSTDCVFSGKEGSYTEDSPTDAQDLYGQSKALGEIVGDNTLTLRCSVIGRELEYKTELLEWFLSQKGKSVSGYNRVIFSGITTIQMSKFVRRLIEDDMPITGIYQIASPQISKYDLLCRIKERFKCDIGIEKDEEHISNKSLMGDKFFLETGYEVPSWEMMIEELAKDPYPYTY